MEETKKLSFVVTSTFAWLFSQRFASTIRLEVSDFGSIAKTGHDINSVAVAGGKRRGHGLTVDGFLPGAVDTVGNSSPALDVQGTVDSDTQLKPLREATTEQVDEILSMALERAKASDDLWKLKAPTEAHGDLKKMAQLIESFYNRIVSPTLSAKGFQKMPIEDFFHEMQLLVDTRYDEFLEHEFELNSILHPRQVNATGRWDAHRHWDKDKAQLTPLREAVAEPILATTVEPCVEEAALREVTAEQFDEILQMSILRAIQPQHPVLWRPKQEEDATIFKIVVSPILIAKGFQEVSLREFKDQIHHVAGVYVRSLQHITELRNILRPQWPDDGLVKHVAKGRIKRLVSEIAGSKLCLGALALGLLSIVCCSYLALRRDTVTKADDKFGTQKSTCYSSTSSSE